VPPTQRSITWSVTWLFREMPRRLLARRRWIRGWCWLCAFSNVCCGFTSEQSLNSTRCMSLYFGGVCLGSKCLPLPSMGITNTPSGRLWCLVGRFCCVGKTQSGMFLSLSSGGSMLRSNNFSLLQASIVRIAEPSLPLLVSDFVSTPCVLRQHMESN